MPGGGSGTNPGVNLPTVSINPPSGNYQSAINVTITGTGTTIRYTTNGVNPTSTTGILYNGPISVNTPTLLKAVAISADGQVSTVASASFTFNTINGILVRFKRPANWGSNVHIHHWDAQPSGVISNSNWPGPAMVSLGNDWYEYTFSGITSTNLLFNNGGSGVQTIDLSRTGQGEYYYHSVATSGSHRTGTWSTTHPDFVPVVTVPALDMTVPTITPSLAAGTYTGAQTVALTYGGTTVPGTIRYTIDGTTPTSTTGIVYSGPIAVNTNTTIRAIAVSNNGAVSSVATFAYVINLPDLSIPTVLISPSGGTYSTAQTVSISYSNTTLPSTIYFTTNGNTPTTASGVYTTPFVVSNTGTVKAIAVTSNGVQSSVATASYIIHTEPVNTGTGVDLTQPVVSITPNSGNNSSPISVVLSVNNTSVTSFIYFTLDGTEPTTASGIYTAPLVISTATTVKAMAVSVFGVKSEVVSRNYTFITANTTSGVDLTQPVVIVSPEGGNFTSPIDVTLTVSNTTVPSTIYFTTDGTSPSSVSGIFSIPIRINTATNIRAIAISQNGVVSEEVSANFTFNLPSTTVGADLTKPELSINPASGEYVNKIFVAMSVNNTTVPSVIYYTTDGTEPTTASFIYNRPFEVSESTIIKAKAISQYGVISDEVTRIYNFYATSIVSEQDLFKSNYIYTDVNTGLSILNFSLNSSATVSIKVMNALGFEIENFDAKTLNAGTYEVDLTKIGQTKGVYIAVVVVNGKPNYQKFVVR
jgi:hypothetical protein